MKQVACDFSSTFGASPKTVSDNEGADRG